MMKKSLNYPHSHRRDFFRQTAGLGVMSYLGIAHLAFAQVQNPPIKQKGPLIVVFQRGAADGLHLLSPLEDPDFIAARSPEMRFAVNDYRVELNDVNFYWHPEAKGIANLYKAKKLLAWHAVGLNNETRSHFEAQEMIERGVQRLDQLPDNLGWMTRQVNKMPISSPLTLFSANPQLPRSMQGALQALSARDLQGGITINGGLATEKAVEALLKVDYALAAAPMMQNNLQAIQRVNQLLVEQSEQAKIIPYETRGATPYPNNDPGVGLRSIARLLEVKSGVQFAWVDQGGWDTHENQPGRMNGLIKNLSGALQAFDEDMQARKQDYTLVVLTEFGRRLRSNRSNGTDHGHGSLALVMGSHVPGGQLMGSWPGLSNHQLDRGVDLAVTTNYEKVLEQALAWT
jgi:uncharacterized protein (DUF1501 family)